MLRALDGFVDEDPRGQARAEAWRGQALRQLGRIEEADQALGRAIQAAKAAGDVAGVAQLRVLRQQLNASLAALHLARQEKARDRTLLDRDDLSPDEQLRKATLLLDEGRVDEARGLLETLVADDLRTRVFRLLALARCGEPGGPIREAHALADAADDQNLLTAVARAAAATGVVLVPPAFG